MKLSKHANKRMQQRGIPPVIVDLLQKFGTVEHVGDGCLSFYFDKQARRKVMAYVGQLHSAIADYLDYYAIFGNDGTVVTVAPRLHRLKH